MNYKNVSLFIFKMVDKLLPVLISEAVVVFPIDTNNYYIIIITNNLYRH